MRKLLILVHRYLGICLCLLFAVWFLSGIAMIYAKGMPRLTPQLKLERLAPLRPEEIRISAREAIERAALVRPPARVLLSTVADRPVYRLGQRTVFADNGETLKEIDASRAIDIAASFMKLPRQRLRQSIQSEADQWTISQRRQMPLHKIIVDDPTRTELYVSPQSGDVVVMTTRATRALAWVGAIPHWLYFTSLRTKDLLWRHVILWTSGLGVVLALIGVTLGFTQYKMRYTGWMRWHYLTGLVFGVFTTTWVFSGLLSMDPWNWSLGGGLGNEIRAALAGGPLAANLFPDLDAASLSRLTGGEAIKEIEFIRIQGAPHYFVRTPAKRLLVSAYTLEFKTIPVTVDSIMDKVARTHPAVPVVESKLLSDYDSYYYSQDRELPLPVLRIKFADKDGTWFYIDTQTSELVRSVHRLGRINRWIYHGFHSLDFPFLYYSRPAWDIAVIALSLGGAASSLIGAYIGFRRLRRGAARLAASNVR